MFFSFSEVNQQYYSQLVRLKDAQKHRLASQNYDCHSKKTFLGASSGTVPGAKKKGFCEDTGIDFFGEVFLGFLIGVIAAWVH